MTVREEFAAARSAIRRCAAFRPKPETVGLLLDPAHAAELTIESEDAAHGLGLGRVDHQSALDRVIAQRHIAAHPAALLPTFGAPAGPGTCEDRRVAGRFGFNPKKSGT